MKSYDIWIGYYNLGQSGKPVKIATITAINFKTACFKQELKSSLSRVLEGERKGNLNNQDYEWNYNPQRNTNSWIGKYYETEEEAWESFKL